MISMMKDSDGFNWVCDQCGVTYTAQSEPVICWVCRLIQIWPQVRNPRENWKDAPYHDFDLFSLGASQAFARDLAKLKVDPLKAVADPTRDRDPNQYPTAEKFEKGHPAWGKPSVNGPSGPPCDPWPSIRSSMRVRQLRKEDIALDWIDEPIMNAFSASAAMGLAWPGTQRTVMNSIKEAYLKRELGKQPDPDLGTCVVCGGPAARACQSCHNQGRGIVFVCTKDSCRNAHAMLQPERSDS